MVGVGKRNQSSLHHFAEAAATELFEGSFTATASDDTFNEALEGLRGTECMETLVSLYFDIRSAFIARPEPLLPEDVHVSRYVLFFCSFFSKRM